MQSEFNLLQDTVFSGTKLTLCQSRLHRAYTLIYQGMELRIRVVQCIALTLHANVIASKRCVRNEIGSRDVMNLHAVVLAPEPKLALSDLRKAPSRIRIAYTHWKKSPVKMHL